MPQRRRPSDTVTPEQENVGHCETQMVEITVELIPQMRHTRENALVVRGFVEKHYEIEIVFAAPHPSEAPPVKDHLHALLAHGRTQAARHGHPLEIDLIRCPVRIEGAWCRRTVRDARDWETHTYQFLAAHWTLLEQNDACAVLNASALAHIARHHDV